MCLTRHHPRHRAALDEKRTEAYPKSKVRQTLSLGDNRVLFLVRSGSGRQVADDRFNHAQVESSDRELRQATFRLFVDLGRAPTPNEVAADLGLDDGTVIEGWRRLHDAHALVLSQGTPEIRMANPFSAVPTAYRVQAGDRWWYANCAWDAFGICAALQTDGLIETSCPDCGDPLHISVIDQRPSDETLLFHVLVPARHWWDDIVFT